MWNNTRIGYIASRGTRTQFYFVLWRIKFCSTRFNEDVYAVYKYIYIHHMHERYYASSSLFTVCNYPHNANILKIGHCRDSISPNEIIATRDRTFARYIISSPDLQDYLENLDMDIKIIRKKKRKKNVEFKRKILNRLNYQDVVLITYALPFLNLSLLTSLSLSFSRYPISSTADYSRIWICREKIESIAIRSRIYGYYRYRDSAEAFQGRSVHGNGTCKVYVLY